MHGPTPSLNAPLLYPLPPLRSCTELEKVFVFSKNKLIFLPSLEEAGFSLVFVFLFVLLSRHTCVYVFLGRRKIRASALTKSNNSGSGKLATLGVITLGVGSKANMLVAVKEARV